MNIKPVSFGLAAVVGMLAYTISNVLYLSYLAQSAQVLRTLMTVNAVQDIALNSAIIFVSAFVFGMVYNLLTAGR